MANATGVVSTRGRRQFQDAFSEHFFASGTMDIGSLADGVGETNTVAVPGVALGDVVLGVSLSVSIAGMTVTAWVSAADVVSVRVQNESGGALDPAAATVKVAVGRPNW